MHHAVAAPALCAHDIAKRFIAGAQGCRAQVVALRCASLVARCGEVIVLVGPAGAGKSTLLLCAAGLLRPDAGTVGWFGSSAPDVTRVRYVRAVNEALDAQRCLATVGGGLLLLDVALEAMNGEERRRAERLASDARRASTALILCARRSTSLGEIQCRGILVERGVTREMRDGAARDRTSTDRVAEARPESVDSPSSHL